MTTIVWLRNDLRLADNRALIAAAGAGPVVPVYILDETESARPLGGASRWWLHKSLAALEADLGGLVLKRGDPQAILEELVERTGAKALYWGRRYDAAGIARDRAIKAAFTGRGLDVKSFNAALLFEPWEVETKTGGPFKVYSPFWRACLGRDVAAPARRPSLDVTVPEGFGDALADWRLLPRSPDWAKGWDDLWQPGEKGAHSRLDAFLEHGLSGYADGRDRIDRPTTSRLSPHLRFGEISPRQVWARVRHLAEREPGLSRDAEKFLAELGWREFSYHLLFHFPTLPTESWKPDFDAYPWRDSAEDLRAWQRGVTGYPLVDAGMRELWATGTMHNRARMVTASFLVKHLRFHWRHGEDWFWDTLVDADPANNAASWQWVAGSGADAAPYFRIFNPVTQGEKFDPDGDYVRRWCPELARLENAWLHKPFDAPEAALRAAGVRLGETYPRPIVDHAAARRAALAGYEEVKRSAQAGG